MQELDALIAAAAQGDLETVRALLGANPDLARQCDSQGVSALHYAALKAYRDIARLLIEHGSPVNRVDGLHGATPAGWAIEYLREFGAFLAIELSDFEYAIATNDVRWVRRFLSRFPALRQAHSLQGTPFSQLAKNSGSREIEELFV
jgi:hypothetical protein